jgi:hypothetical protein
MLGTLQGDPLCHAGVCRHHADHGGDEHGLGRREASVQVLARISQRAFDGAGQHRSGAAAACWGAYFQSGGTTSRVEFLSVVQTEHSVSGPCSFRDLRLSVFSFPLDLIDEDLARLATPSHAWHSMTLMQGSRIVPELSI